jgi:branched-chain amino acid transport system ATP-binding protein
VTSRSIRGGEDFVKVAAGAICGLMGPNGAGKTTLFDCISRLYDPGGGSMVFDGRPLASLIRHELASLGIARDCFKRPAPN